jgi:hypothetical protein
MAILNQAYNKYNQATPQGYVVKGVPRTKFNFTASLNYINGGFLELDKVAQVSMPSWTSSAITMNAYNAKKIVQTNYEYTPITLIAYDTHSPSVMQNFLKEYSNYYFACPMNMADINAVNSHGFKLQKDRNFIKSLNIVRRDNQSVNRIQIYNPIFTNIDSDTLDYSDSSLSQYRITIMYEGYDITDITTPDR